MRPDAEALSDRIEGALRAQGTGERAAGEKRYLKSDLEFLGTTVRQTRLTVKAFLRDLPGLDHRELVALVRALWARPIHERRMAAVFLLESSPALLRPADMSLIERLVLDSRTWALVDGLAADVTGELIVRHPEAADRLDRWAVHPDFWLRRAALLALIEPLRAGADFGRFAGYADPMLQEREFFIRKAIGWVLREVSKVRPEEVWAWIGPRADRASGVTIREAMKYLPDGQARELLAAQRERRPARDPDV